MRAIIFDCDGVLVDTEPIVMRLTQQMAARQGWTLSEEEYYRDYLAYDDRRTIERLFELHGANPHPARVNELLAWKTRNYWEAIRKGVTPCPGAVDFVRKAASRYPLAIASGSLGVEIASHVDKLGIRDCFFTLTSADDCEHSKPHPEPYLTALASLQSLPQFQKQPLRPEQCLVVEDSPGGIQAARAAGMRCVALTHSRPLQALGQADWVYHHFNEINLDRIAAAFGKAVTTDK